MSEAPWTVAEVAAFLKHPQETIRRWARSGKLPSLGKDLAGEWRFDPEAIRASIRPAKIAAVDQELIRRRLDMAYAKARATWRRA